ncbi:hypothetical protein [Modestobacter lapidis]|nr:hypothetical protein [Modestobacter lapidis]
MVTCPRPPSRERPLTRHLAPIAAGLLVLLFSACGQGGGTVCPAIGWGSEVRAELTGDWTGTPVGEVEIACSPACPPIALREEGTGEPAPSATSAGPESRGVPFGSRRPDSAVVTVLGADGAVLARVDSDLEWVRTGGSEECGGPMTATVAVPAP